MILLGRRKASPPTKEQKKLDMLRRMGVEHPETRNMNRNVMHAQIETFDKTRLRPLADQQRYMVSPHDDVRNFMANSRGMGEQAMRDHHPVVRPVFKDNEQRRKFHELAKNNLAGLGSFATLTTDKQKRDYRTYEQLRDWSHKDNAMMNFRGVDTKRSHPVVFVQGHGAAGDKSIYSDSGEAQSFGNVAKMLKKMDLPKVSQIRVNSCYSGTQTDLSAMPDVRNKFRNQAIESHAGDWGRTFAGALDHELNTRTYKDRYQAHKAEVDKVMGRSLGRWGRVKAFFNSSSFTEARKKAIDKVSQRHNRVVGYMGPTTQGSATVTTRSPLGKLSKKEHTAVVFGPKGARQYYKHSDVSRTGPSVRGKK